MGSPYTLTPKDNNPFYDTSFNIKMRLTLFSASLSLAADAVWSNEARKFSQEKALIFRVPLILEMIIERFFVEEEEAGGHSPQPQC